MTEEIVQRFIHRLFNSDLSKDGKAIKSYLISIYPYINIVQFAKAISERKTRLIII